MLQLIADFINSCRARRLSPRTLEWYGWLLGEYRDFVERRSLDWDKPMTLDAFLADVARHASAHTQHAHYRALRRFFNWLEKRHAIAENPMRMIEPPRLPACRPHHISPEEVAQLLETTAKETWLDRRDRAIILFLWDTGLRAGELCNLELSDLDLERRVILIRNGKGAKDRG